MKRFLSLLLLLLPGSAWCTQVVVLRGNIYAKTPRGVAVQLTHSGRDSDPCLSRDGRSLVFVRDTPGRTLRTGAGEQPANELWLLDIRTRLARRIARAVPDHDPRNAPGRFARPVFAWDGKSVYVLCSAWAVSDAVQKIALKGYSARFVTDGNALAVVTRGPYRGHLAVVRAMIRTDAQGESLGRNSCLWLLSPDGRPIREIGPLPGPAARQFLMKNRCDPPLATAMDAL